MLHATLNMHDMCGYLVLGCMHGDTVVPLWRATWAFGSASHACADRPAVSACALSVDAIRRTRTSFVLFAVMSYLHLTRPCKASLSVPQMASSPF
jgi:hypothetical protein